MSELSQRGQELLRQSRAALRPQTADRERVLVSLRQQIGVPAGIAGKLAAAAQAARASWTIATAALIGVSGVVAVGLSSTPTQGNARTAAASVVSAPSVVSRPVLPSTPAVAPLPVDSVVVPAPSAQNRHDRLAAEVAILSQAAKDLRSGRPADALSALNEHQKKFPNGLLTQERRAARAEALCSLGRYTEAQSELSTLSRTAPQSPLTVQAQTRCQARPAKSR
jgi:TolA-binding protein